MRATTFIVLLVCICGLFSFGHAFTGPEIVYVDGKPVTLPTNDDDPSLYKYMDIPDASFSWKADFTPFKNDTKHQLLHYRMKLNSLQWLTEAEVTPSQWTHDVVVIRPYIPLPGKAMLWIEGCANNEDFEVECYQRDISLVADLAQSTGMMVFILFHVPNQPSVFASDPDQGKLMEDRLVSFSWNTFMTRAQNRPDWIAYFPMAKASLRCLDAGEGYSKDLVAMGMLTQPITKWYIFGMSKRGAATWFLTAYLGARQPHRIIGSAPVVFEALNFKEVVLESMPAKLGGFTHVLSPYRASIPFLLEDQKLEALSRHIDLTTPWYHKGLTAVPKYVVSAALDEFFMLGNDRYWYDQLENKHRLIVPHADHIFILDIDWLYKGVAAHATALVSGVGLPFVLETVDYKAQTITMCSEVKPTQSVLYSASPNPQTIPRLDFRMLKPPIADNCLPPATLTDKKCISIAEWQTDPIEVKFVNGLWCAHHHQTNIPSDTWIASYIVFSFDEKSPKGNGVYTTPVMILPDHYPFVGCLTDKKNCPMDIFI